jgi:hypothetical protein
VTSSSSNSLSGRRTLLIFGSLCGAQTIWDKWKDTKNTWGSSEFEFSCSGHDVGLKFPDFRISKNLIGGISLFGMDSSANWQLIDYDQEADGGLFFSTIGWVPIETLAQDVYKSQEYAALKSKVNIAVESDNSEIQKQYDDKRKLDLEMAKRDLASCESRDYSEEELASLSVGDRRIMERKSSFPDSDLEASQRKSLDLGIKRERCSLLDYKVSSLSSSFSDIFNRPTLREMPQMTVHLPDGPISMKVQLNFRTARLSAQPLDPVSFRISVNGGGFDDVRGTLDALPAYWNSCTPG